MNRKFVISIISIIIPFIIMSQTVFIVYSGNNEKYGDFAEYFKNRARMDFLVFDMNDIEVITSVVGKITVEKPLAVLLIGDEAINSIAPYVNNIPLILGLSNNISPDIMKKSNLCGVTAGGGADSLAFYIKKTFSEIRKAGLIFNMEHSIDKAKNMKTAADSIGLQMELGNINSKDDIKMSIKLLKASGCELILFFEDQFFLNRDNFNVLLNESKKEAIPLITIGEHYEKQGIMGTFVFDVYNAGYEAGNLALRLKNGEKCSDIGMKPAGGLSFKYSSKIIKQYKIKISQDMIEKSEEF